MADSKDIQLNLTKRRLIKRMLSEGASATDIGGTLGIHKSSVSREIARNRSQGDEPDPYNGLCENCELRLSCPTRRGCGPSQCGQCCSGCLQLKSCESRVPFECRRLTRFPYVCDGCQRSPYCGLQREVYDPDSADEKTKIRRSEARRGLDLTPRELSLLDDAVSEGVKNGVPVYSIAQGLTSPKRCTKSLYNYINAGYFRAKRMDLPMAVSLKKRKRVPSKYQYDGNNLIDRSGRTYRDFLLFRAESAITHWTEMDFLGETNDSEQRILNFTIPQIQFALLRVLPKGCEIDDVVGELDRIERAIGTEAFRRVFGTILTDRDTVFKGYLAIERSVYGGQRCRVFYCDPAASNQKPFVENHNGQIRVFFPKGSPIVGLTEPALREINSQYVATSKESIGGLSAYVLFVKMFGKGVADALGIREVPPEERVRKHYLSFIKDKEGQGK